MALMWRAHQCVTACHVLWTSLLSTAVTNKSGRLAFLMNRILEFGPSHQFKFDTSSWRQESGRTCEVPAGIPGVE
jgi:hypothetical protein